MCRCVQAVAFLLATSAVLFPLGLTVSLYSWPSSSPHQGHSATKAMVEQSLGVTVLLRHFAMSWCDLGMLWLPDWNLYPRQPSWPWSHANDYSYQAAGAEGQNLPGALSKGSFLILEIRWRVVHCWYWSCPAQVEKGL